MWVNSFNAIIAASWLIKQLYKMFSKIISQSLRLEKKLTDMWENGRNQEKYIYNKA